jgi:polysaccharide pyruvyl transferase WcaK-like protein
MKVLHLASFSGNIGDNANHSGFRPWLERLAGRPVSWTDLEIRENYWKERVFDEAFVDYVNTFDLFVIGGGNYFELWVERSHTGTSIDIPLELFSRIKPPVFFNALGCDAGQGTTEKTIQRFNAFLEVLVSSPQYLVTVRNDGAHQTLRRYVPPAVADKVTTIPDGGFFLEPAEANGPYVHRAHKLIGINLACDMPEIRFRQFGDPGGYEAFCDEFAAMLGTIAARQPNLDFVFFPHIFSDLKIVSAVVSRMNDRVRRTRTNCAPYMTGCDGARHVFGLYRKCDLMLGMRFHANVCALALGVPAIGLFNYPQIEYLYQELSFSERCFNVQQPGFSSALAESVVASLHADPFAQERERALQRVVAQRRAYEPVLSAWLMRHGLGGAA